MLNEEQGRVLIRLVRKTIGDHLGIPVSDPPSAGSLADPALREQCGVFVTLNRRGSLRGCIGSLMARESLVDGVRRHAINAAFHDHRFPPVTAAEFAELSVNVSILSPPQSLDYGEGGALPILLRPGLDGVILSSPDGASATFLPQVWKQLPDPEQFLGQLCRKAGLAADRWRRGDLRIETYQAQYFEEDVCCH